MTFRVHFFAEQAFLSHVKRVLDAKDKSKEIEDSAVCVLACASAIEAVANHLLAKVVGLKHFDELRLQSKIEYLMEQGGNKSDWGADPLQSAKRLIQARNWLAHYKESSIGLVNGNFDWLEDSSNSSPRIDPYRELSFVRLEHYYACTRTLLQTLVSRSGGSTSDYDYLQSERYEPFLVG
jgi:hypothetical protein